MAGSIKIQHGGTASTPQAGYSTLWVKASDGEFYYTKPDGSIESLVGPTGQSGTSGTSGISGSSGSSGTSGTNGSSGTSGSQGATGPITLVYLADAVGSITVQSEFSCCTLITTTNYNWTVGQKLYFYDGSQYFRATINSKISNTSITIQYGTSSSVGYTSSNWKIYQDLTNGTSGTSGSSGTSGVNGATGATGPAGAGASSPITVENTSTLLSTGIGGTATAGANYNIALGNCLFVNGAACSIGLSTRPNGFNLVGSSNFHVTVADNSGVGNGNNNIVIATNSNTFSNGSVSVNLGASNYNQGGQHHVAIGADNGNQGGNRTVLIGKGNSHNSACDDYTAIGTNNALKESQVQAFGTCNTIFGGATGTTVIGNSSVGATGNCNSIVIGNTQNIGSTLHTDTVLIGSNSCVIQYNDPACPMTRNILIGSSTKARSGAGGNDNVVIGTNACIDGSQGCASVIIGLNACGGNYNSVAIGVGTRATADASVAIGSGANSGAFGVAMGYNMAANGRSVAIGFEGTANGEGAVVVGRSANAGSACAIAIGYTPAAPAASAIAIGNNARACSACSIAIGDNADTQDASRPFAIAIGTCAKIAQCSVALGSFATSNGVATVAIGYLATSGNVGGVAIGDSACAGPDATVAIGKCARTDVAGGIAIGCLACSAGTSYSIAIGQNARALNLSNITLGNNSYSGGGAQNTSVGDGITNCGRLNTVIGAALSVGGCNNVSVGYGSAGIGTGSCFSISMMGTMPINTIQSIAIGYQSWAGSLAGTGITGGIAMGRFVYNQSDCSVVIGACTQSSVDACRSITIATGTCSFAPKSIVIGDNLTNYDSSRLKSILIGTDICATQCTVNIGNCLFNGSQSGVMIGNLNRAGGFTNGVMLGWTNCVQADENQVLIGQNNFTCSNSAIAIGLCNVSNVAGTGLCSIAIGQNNVIGHTGAAVMGSGITTVAMNTTHLNSLYVKTVPVYADNTAAKAGGLVDGQTYRTSTGQLNIVYT